MDAPTRSSVFQDFLQPGQSFVVTDTETTGTRPNLDRIMEIGAVRTGSDAPCAVFSELINPGVAIPSRITRITGITTGQLHDKPSSGDVLPRYMEFLGDGLLTAHNLAFDRNFLSAELIRCGLEPLQGQGLCTLRLARRLLPGLRSKSLGSLATFFRMESSGRHRAQRDAEITTAILERLLQIAIDEHGIGDLDELVALQSRTYASVRPLSAHVERIRRETLPDLPDEPGVYRMKDGRGKVLYIGKARSLSSRVRSYFNAVEAHPARIRKLIAAVRRVDWDVLPTELDALIVESRCIKQEDPPYNRAQTRWTQRPWLRIHPDEPFSRVTAQVLVRCDGARYFGPLKSRKQAASLLEIIERVFRVRNCSAKDLEAGRRCLRGDMGRCLMPCEQPDAEDYSVEVSRVEAFLKGDVEDVVAQLEADMARAVAALDFETAARIRDWLHMIDSLLAGGGAVAAPMEGVDRAAWLAGPDDAHATAALVRHGLLVWTARLPLPVGAGNLEHIHARWEEVMEYPVPTAHPTAREEADARRVLESWMYAHRAHVLIVDRRPGEGSASWAQRLMDRIMSGG